MGSSSSEVSASSSYQGEGEGEGFRNYDDNEGYVASQMVSTRDPCNDDFVKDSCRCMGESFKKKEESFNPTPERFSRGFAFKSSPKEDLSFKPNLSF